jgi:hypothetical protein
METEFLPDLTQAAGFARQRASALTEDGNMGSVPLFSSASLEPHAAAPDVATAR